MSPRDIGAAEKPAAAPRAAAPSPFDPANFVAQQQRIAEALAASGQKFLEGLQEIAQRSALLQSAMIQQALTGFASITTAAGPGQPGGDAVRQATAAAEATVASLRDVMEAACKCHTEAFATFQRHVAGTASDAGCEVPQRRG